MILLYAILFILPQSIVEALLTKYALGWNKVVRICSVPVGILLFAVWYLYCTSPTIYYVPTWKLATGYVFVRFAIYDLVWNITTIIMGTRIPIWYYGPEDDPKLYDRIMIWMGGFGWFCKLVFGIVGIVFLLGYK